MYLDIYEGSVYRPPSEAYSLILQATIGCSWNRCTFCTMFKDKKYREKSLEQIKADVELIYPHYDHIKKIFLADGNALAMPTKDLLKILKYLYKKFKHLKKVTIYGGPLDIVDKSVKELKQLKEAGLQMIYIGLESGSDTVLKLVKKGALSKKMITAGQRVKESGLKLSLIWILGLGGKELSKEHALETARVVSAIDPDYGAALTLMVDPGSQIEKDVESGKISLLNPKEALEELRLTVENLDVSEMVFRCNHASNYVTFRGTLNKEKKAVLTTIDDALKQGDFKPDMFRRL